jgi:hypothetical protein
VTLIDRTNYHLFQPLNYQVAAAALYPDEIAEPLRTIFRRDRNVRVLLGEVTELDLERRAVVMRPGVDGLIKAALPGNLASALVNHASRPLLVVPSARAAAQRIRDIREDRVPAAR